MKKLLIIGAVPDEKNVVGYGGATVLMKNFIDFLSTKEVRYEFVQTNKFYNKKSGNPRSLVNALFFIITFFVRVWFADIVMFNFSDHGLVNYFPFLSKVAKCLGKKVVLRKFGGSLDIYLSKIDEKKIEKVVTALQQADLIFIETKFGISHLECLIGKTDKIHWFPNVRKPAQCHKASSDFNKKCVFMSHINTEKGVDELLQVAKMLPEGYSIDLYGAIKEEKYRNFDFDSYGVTYHGEISSKQVLQLLPKYSLLLLSSYREGYPGIIIEALSTGVPVVASNIGGIPEIITDGYNGKLMQPGDVQSLYDAILSFDADNYAQYSVNALKSFDNFNSELVNVRILDLIIK